VANTIVRLPTAPAKLIEVILAGVKLLEQQQEIYQGRLQEFQQNALEEAYRQASLEIDLTWDVTIADGL
jgi:hypothetical protein